MCEKYSMSVEALRHRTACPSAAASALPKRVKMRTISRAKRSAAWACSARWSLVPSSHPHDRITSARNHAARRAFGRNHTLHTITQGTTGVWWNHLSTRSHPTRRAISTTGGQHNGRSYHASTTGECTTEGGTMGDCLADELFTKKGLPTTFPSGRTACPSVAPLLIDRY